MSTFHHPPKTPLRLLKWFCSEDRLEELEGDLCEVYNEYIEENGTQFSAIFYWWIVIRSVRRFALKKSKMKNNGLSGTFMFFQHNMTVAIRNLWKHKTSSAINMAGLSIGIAAFIIVFRIVSYELSFNKEINDYDKIYRVYTQFSGSFDGTNQGVSSALFNHFNLPSVKNKTLFYTFTANVQVDDKSINFNSTIFNRNIAIVQPTYFEVVDHYSWTAGSIESLNEPHRVILTEEQAQLYFPDSSWDDIIGQKVSYRDSLHTYVGGIVNKKNGNTDFRFTEFISFSTITQTTWLKEQYKQNEWISTSSNTQLWLKLNNETVSDDINQELLRVTKLANAERDEEDFWSKSFRLQPLSDVHFNVEMGTIESQGADLDSLKTVSVVAAFILMIAIFNFVNLETAQIISKSKEAAIRKVSGSTDGQVIGRFLFQSLILSMTGTGMALPIAYGLMEIFPEHVPNEIGLNLMDPMIWLAASAVGLFVGLLSGLYPALLIKSKGTIDTLKSRSLVAKNSKNYLLRRGLIIGQFVLSQMLIMGTFIMLSQLEYVSEKDLGFTKEGIVYLQTPWYRNESKIKLLTNELNTLSELSEISTAQSPPAFFGYSSNTVSYHDGQENISVEAFIKYGDSTYLDFYDIKLIAGQLPQANQIVVNEALAKKLGFSSIHEAIGKPVNDERTISGVMRDFHFMSLHYDIDPMYYKMENDGQFIAMKLTDENQLRKTINQIESKWNLIYPDDPFVLKFYDEELEAFYEEDLRMSKMISSATVMVIILSSLGLFGLVTFSANAKTKEIGVRKILGANATQISSILSREFILLIAIASIISIPASIYLGTNWMEGFAYQVGISPLIFIGSIGLSILLAMVTISVKVVKAANANPVDSLRYE